MGPDDRLLHELQEQNRGLVEQNERLRNRLAFEDSLWQSEENRGERAARGVGGGTLRMHAIELVDGMIGDPARLCGVTGCTRESFGIILERFTDTVMDDEDRPLFWEDDARSRDARNRRRLHVRHALFAVLMSLRTGATQQHLAATLDVDQSTMSRYLRYCIVILHQILPIAEKMTDVIRRTPADRIEEKLIPKRTILIDGTLTPAGRPWDRTARKTRYAGRRKRHTYDTPVTVNLDGLLILHCDDTANGSVNDKGVMNAGAARTLEGTPDQ